VSGFAQTYKISDVCMLVSDVERSIGFYRDRLGFVLRRRAEGFADFRGAGITLALWEIGHMAEHTGVSPRIAPPGAHKNCVAVELPSAGEVDAVYRTLSQAGVAFVRPPADHIWNARCCYFADPDDNLWELYAWLTGGPVGDVDEVET
jgi:catechol 2,3-dioxygenase-like lactoylglutathione lyase family enzyme